MLQIEIFSDVVCPWCFIGKRRLDEVLASPVGDGVAVEWRPYQLYPSIGLQGMDRVQYLQRRYGDQADPGKVPSRIADEAASLGLELRYDRIRRMPNTLMAHRLLDHAQQFGAQHALAEKLFQAYFCDGKDVGDLETLVKLAQEVGLAAQQSRDYLKSDAGTEFVQEQLARAPEVGVTGVPGYLLAGTYLLPGAQTSEVMAQIITRAKQRLT